MTHEMYNMYINTYRKEHYDDNAPTIYYMRYMFHNVTMKLFFTE